MKINRFTGLALFALVALVALAFDASAAPLLHYVDPAALVVAGALFANAAPALKLEDIPALAKELQDKIEEVKSIAVEFKAKTGEGTKIGEKAKEDADKAITECNGLKLRLDEFEQKLAKRTEQPTEERIKSWGQQVVESKEYTGAIEHGKTNTGKISVKDISSATSPINSMRDAEIVGMERRLPTIRSLLSVVETDSNAIDYWVQSVRTLNAAPVAENAAKPYSTLEWIEKTINVRTIAHLIKISRQAYDDAKQLAGEIDTELRYGLMLAEETQLLFGDGTGQNLTGMVPAATAYSAAFAVAGETMIDKLRLAALQASLNLFPATGHIIHPSDWARIELTKDAENRYIFANPMQLAGPNLWGLPVVPTLAMTIDKFLTGAFKTAVTLYDRMEPEILISSENVDDFEKNRLTVRGEERLAQAIKRPKALIYGDFGNVA